MMAGSVDEGDKVWYERDGALYRCKLCGTTFYSKDVQVAIDEGGKSAVVSGMRCCPKCGYPLSGYEPKKVLKDFYSYLEQCDEPEWTWYNEVIACTSKYIKRCEDGEDDTVSGLRPGMRCETCGWWEPDEGRASGTCHAAPPSGGFPVTRPDQWCGKWSTNDLIGGRTFKQEEDRKFEWWDEARGRASGVPF